MSYNCCLHLQNVHIFCYFPFVPWWILYSFENWYKFLDTQQLHLVTSGLASSFPLLRCKASFVHFLIWCLPFKVKIMLSVILGMANVCTNKTLSNDSLTSRWSWCIISPSYLYVRFTSSNNYYWHDVNTLRLTWIYFQWLVHHPPVRVMYIVCLYHRICWWPSG